MKTKVGMTLAIIGSLSVGVGAKISQQRVEPDKPIIVAAKNKDLTKVKRLIEGGANVNTTDDIGWTPLHYAANNAQLDMVDYLIKKGADIRSKGIKGNTLSPVQVLALKANTLGIPRVHPVMQLFAAAGSQEAIEWGSQPARR